MAADPMQLLNLPPMRIDPLLTNHRYVLGTQLLCSTMDMVITLHVPRFHFTFARLQYSLDVTSYVLPYPHIWCDADGCSTASAKVFYMATILLPEAVSRFIHRPHKHTSSSRPVHCSL